MGKKSSPVSSHVQSSSLEREEVNNIPEGFSPVLAGVLEDMKDLLMRELLKILLQEKLLEENREKQDLKEQVRFPQTILKMTNTESQQPSIRLAGCAFHMSSSGSHSLCTLVPLVLQASHLPSPQPFHLLDSRSIAIVSAVGDVARQM